MKDFAPAMRTNPEADLELMEATSSLFAEAEIVSATSLATIIKFSYFDYTKDNEETHFYKEEDADFVKWLTPLERSFSVEYDGNKGNFMQVECQGTLRRLEIDGFSSVRYLSLAETEDIDVLLTTKHPNIKRLTRALFVLNEADIVQNDGFNVNPINPSDVQLKTDGTNYEKYDKFWYMWQDPTFRRVFSSSPKQCY